MTKGAPAGVALDRVPPFHHPARIITPIQQFQIENSQKLELIKASQVKLKRKVDLQSVKIFDRPTSQQGRQIFMVPLKRNDAVIMNMLFTSSIS
ncbi:unnamed protein product [Rhizophagus irregularis]|nr:unnamed protein product [Rhizophagus irregularis]